MAANRDRAERIEQDRERRAAARAPGLRLHKRTMRVERADADLTGLLIDFEGIRELTPTEMLVIIDRQFGRYLKRLLRAERHPGQPDKKADEA